MPWVQRGTLAVPQAEGLGYNLISFGRQVGEQGYGLSYDQDGTGAIPFLRVGFYGAYAFVSGRLLITPSLDCIPTLASGTQFLNPFAFDFLEALDLQAGQLEALGAYFAPAVYCPPGVVRVYGLTP